MKKPKKINIQKNLVIDKTGHKNGKIKLCRVSQKLKTPDLKIYYIKFEKGAQSKLHLHDSDQVIIGEKGKACLAVYSGIDITGKNRANLTKEKRFELKEGEAVLIPAGTLHWHGASKTQNSTQLSVMKNGSTFWF